MASGPPLIYLESGSGVSILILPKGEFDSGPPPVLSTENIKIGGHPAVRVDFGTLSDGTRLVMLHILDWFPDNRIELTTSNEATQSQLTELNEILSTFKLTGMAR
jgi:hypothetical protein